MSALADLLNLVVTSMQMNSLCTTVRVLDTHQFSDRQYALKVRAELAGGGSLQVRLYRNGDHTDYAYHVSIADTALRWDNKEHFRLLSSHPHHFHNASGRVETSLLNGDPAHDLPVVLSLVNRIAARE